MRCMKCDVRSFKYDVSGEAVCLSYIACGSFSPPMGESALASGTERGGTNTRNIY